MAKEHECECGCAPEQLNVVGALSLVTGGRADDIPGSAGLALNGSVVI